VPTICFSSWDRGENHSILINSSRLVKYLIPTLNSKYIFLPDRCRLYALTGKNKGGSKHEREWGIRELKKGNFFHCSTIDNFFGSILGRPSSSIRRRIPIIKSLWQTILFPIVCVYLHIYWYVSITKEMDHGGKCYKNINIWFRLFRLKKLNFLIKNCHLVFWHFAKIVIVVEDLEHMLGKNNDHDLCMNMQDEPPRCETRPFREIDIFYNRLFIPD
jgi:hypothetical protein